MFWLESRYFHCPGSSPFLNHNWSTGTYLFSTPYTALTFVVYNITEVHLNLLL